jgi:purine-binding chemotaxis protein CheW
MIGERNLDELLARRAERLAEAEVLVDEVARIEILVFTLGKLSLGASLGRVRGAVPLDRVAAVPLAPPALLGVIDFHGSVVPVVDLGVLLEIPSEVYDRRAGLICGGAEDRVVLAVGDVIELRRYRVEDLRDVPVGLASEQVHCVSRSTLDGVAILDLGRVLEDSRLRFTPRAGRLPRRGA